VWPQLANHAAGHDHKLVSIMSAAAANGVSGNDVSSISKKQSMKKLANVIILMASMTMAIQYCNISHHVSSMAYQRKERK